MVFQVLVLCSFLAIRAWASDYQTILTQIAAGNSDCNSAELFGEFDLRTVPQFNALCNIPIPDIKQTVFLLENNVIPILCMGLLDVSLKLCKSAKNDVSRFEEIFPPNTVKFNQAFHMLSMSKNYSLLDEFCSSTVNYYVIKDPASNITEIWWQVLNRQLSDKKKCENMCHSNERSKVNPLCSYILWSNGLYLNYLKTLKDEESINGGDIQNSPVTKNVDEVFEEGGKPKEIIGFIKNDSSTKPTETALSPNLDLSLGNKVQGADGTKFSFPSDNNIVGVGTVEQVGNNGDQISIASTVISNANPSENLVKLAKKDDKPKSKHHKIKEALTTIKPSGSSKVESDSSNQSKPALLGDQTGVKADPNAHAAAASSNNPEPQNNVASAAPIIPEPQKPSETQKNPEVEKGGEGMVEGDISLEVTPEGIALDQPITADKDFQPPYSDEEGEDGDGDDVDIVESSAHTNTNTAINSSKPAPSKAGEASIQQGPLEGDKVYGEGEILIEDHFIEAEDSHFFTYFLCMAVLTIMAYLAFHNKKKLIALAVEGRRTKGGRRRPNSSHYSKLDCSLEEALVSNTTASVTHVLY